MSGRPSAGRPEETAARRLAWPWLLMGVVVGGVIGLAALLVPPMLAPPPAAPPPVLTVVPAPSATPITPTRTATPTPLAPTETPFAQNPVDGDISVGDLVEVSGTAGKGLRLRAEAGLSAPVNVLALEHEVFEVREGPSETDGYVWWFLVNPYNDAKQGWAVASFLSPLEK